MLKKWIREYIEINKREILLIIIMLFVGVLVGIGAYLLSSTSAKELAITSVREVFDISKSETYISTNIILNGIKADTTLILVLSILSVTLFGRWVIYLIMMLKGAALSIYTILIFNVFGPLWGMLVFLLLVVLVNVLYIPALIYLTVGMLDVNFNIFKARLNSINSLVVYKLILTVIMSFVIMFSSIVVEQVLSSVALNIYTKI